MRYIKYSTSSFYFKKKLSDLPDKFLQLWTVPNITCKLNMVELFLVVSLNYLLTFCLGIREDTEDSKELKISIFMYTCPTLGTAHKIILFKKNILQVTKILGLGCIYIIPHYNKIIISILAELIMGKHPTL